MSRPTGRRVAARPPSWRTRLRGASGRGFRWFVGSWVPFLGFLLLVGAGLGLLVAALLGEGPPRADEYGAVAVATGYAWALAARTGGRPVLFGTLAAVVGVAVLVADSTVLRSGVAVSTAAMSAVLGVLATRPASTFLRGLRELTVALLVAAVGGLAAVGFRPEVDVERFGYLTLAIALVLVFALVYRLGAGFHGLGRRGLLVVLVGCLVLGLILAYAELLSRYGTPGLVDAITRALTWSVDTLGAVPRPLPALLGVPALVWGCYQRARRRQGWWACGFGVTATAPVCILLVDPGISLQRAGLSVAYGAVIGLLIGYLVIRADLFLTGPRGRRARRQEEADAIRPEPRRTRPLL